ncbi:asparagine synthase-related protein [Winogradskyella sp.]|uniref:asparagine synthase-related protein n=1 Tax=Winogradskyella sp. TaxID=1883156 RepID=UPI003AA84BD4
MGGFLIEIMNSKGNDGNRYQVRNNLSLKFASDECYVDNEEILLILKGVILNKQELKETSSNSWDETVLKLFLSKGATFYETFRGSFCGALYNKTSKTWIVFQDHIGSKNIYYCSTPDGFIIATKITDIYSSLRDKGIKNTLDINAAYMLLSYGYMLEDSTLSKRIRKMIPGSYLEIRNNKIARHSYYAINNTPNKELTENLIIETIDELFKKAIRRQFKKDQEYGYKHLVPLSGGLDTRLTCFVAHKLGYNDQLNFTFSQPNSLDEKIPKQISADLNHDWIFKSLANGLFLKEIEDITKITGGNVIYYGLGHGYSFYRLINFDSLGMVHSGQLGDVILGSYTQNDKHIDAYSFHDGSYSKKLIGKVKLDESITQKYKTHEEFLFTQRGLGGINDGLMAIQEFTETMSPFYDVDFLNFALTIPLKYRNKQRIYKKWMLQKYPETARYVWEKTGEKINTPKIEIRGKEITVNKLLKRTLIKLNILKSGHRSKYTMNPMDYWVETNSDLKNFLQNYFQENIDKIENPELKNDCTQLFMDGRTVEKIQVLSLLSAVKLYF